jgi:hypothetical protein
VAVSKGALASPAVSFVISCSTLFAYRLCYPSQGGGGLLARIRFFYFLLKDEPPRTWKAKNFQNFLEVADSLVIALMLGMARPAQLTVLHSPAQMLC